MTNSSTFFAELLATCFSELVHWEKLLLTFYLILLFWLNLRHVTQNTAVFSVILVVLLLLLVLSKNVNCSSRSLACSLSPKAKNEHRAKKTLIQSNSTIFKSINLIIWNKSIFIPAFLHLSISNPKRTGLLVAKCSWRTIYNYKQPKASAKHSRRVRFLYPEQIKQLASLSNADEETQFTRLLFHLRNVGGKWGSGGGIKTFSFCLLPSTLTHARLKMLFTRLTVVWAASQRAVYCGVSSKPAEVPAVL